MATYLKNTYIDGSLVVEGDLKVKNIDLSEASIPVIENPNDAQNKLVKTGTSFPEQLEPTGLDLTEDQTQAVTLRLSSESYNGNQIKPLTQFNIVTYGKNAGNVTADTSIISFRDTGTSAGFKACVLCPDPTDANDHNGELYLWNEAKYQDSQPTADYKWHFTPQPGTAQS